MKRKALLACLVLAAMMAGLAVGVLAWRPWVIKITPELVERIQPGMNLTEVEAVLGCPPGDHTHGRYVRDDGDFFFCGTGLGKDPPHVHYHSWTTETGFASVRFTHGCVETASFDRVCLLRPEPWLDRIKRWLGVK